MTFDFRFHLVGPVPPVDFVGDGCTNAPDGFDDLNWSEACRWHDWAYTLGGTEQNRLDADRALVSNLIELGCPLSLAEIFFYRVRFWGISHFNYGTNKKPGFWYCLWLLIARYWQ